MGRHLAVALSIAALTLIGFFQFPGHTYLHSDTQIYIPMLEHLRDPSLLQRDLIATRPHVTFTVYDEIALFLRRWTGASFRDVLVFQQMLLRALGVLGAYLIATSLGISRFSALGVAGAFSLGATIVGPSVLTFEYEPVPRGFAVPLIVLAVGCAAHGRMFAAGATAAAAFLYHPPTVFVFWAVYSALALRPSEPERMSRRIRGLIPLAAAVLVMFALSRLQPGVSEPQVFFEKVDPLQEKLQRMRANYNYVSIWAPVLYKQYVLLFAVAMAALARLWKSVSEELRFFALGLPVLGMLSVPASYLLLEKMKWALIPQVQPTRALLFVVVFTVILAAAAGVQAARAGRWMESLAWFAPAYLIPAYPRLLDLFTRLGDASLRRRALVALLLAGAAALAAGAEARRKRWAAAAWLIALLAPFFAVPILGKVENYPHLATAELAELSAWARSSTPREAVFLFPDAGQGLDPGIFRAESLRALYVDYKSGGQVNFMKAFGREWWSRWRQTMQGKFDPARVPQFASLGIDYIVLRASHRLPSAKPVFENSRYVVYPMHDGGVQVSSHATLGGSAAHAYQGHL